MKWRILAGLVLAGLLRAAGASDGKFTAAISRQDLAAAGLSGLTPAQLARLNELVEDYKNGIIASARRTADDALVAKQAAEAQAARAEEKAQAARLDAVKAEARRAESARVEAGTSAEAVLPAPKARKVPKPAKQTETAPIETSIPGPFRGWEPRQVFLLANGQHFQVANNESYYTPVVENPKVLIVPAAFAGYWLRFPNLGTQVRVNLVGDK